MRNLLGLASLAAAMMAVSAARADITIGFVTSLSGNAASIGIPYSRGIAAADEYRSQIGGEHIRLIQLDDASDPSAATRDARKLVQEDKADVLIGTATTPSTNAMAAVAEELHVPMVAIAPLKPQSGANGGQWAVTVVQPAALLISVVADRMKRDGIKTVGVIGFSDAWGDLVYNGMKAAEGESGVRIVANERYARTDTSVTGQILKIMSLHPDAVLDGGSGTQGALPLLELAARGFRGKIYGTIALINPDFVRVGGKAAEGIQVCAGPVLVAEQLPDTNPIKQVALTFRAAYAKANGAAPTDAFSPFAFDSWLLVTAAAERAMQTAKPGTPEFRAALRDQIFKTRELVGTQQVFNFKPGDTYGVDKRSLVMVRLTNGVWKYAP